MNKSDAMVCTVCRKHKHTLRPRRSKLNPSVVLHLCNDCFEGKFEPRAFVIIVARDKRHGGLEKVRDYIRHHKYAGDKITAEELV